VGNLPVVSSEHTQTTAVCVDMDIALNALSGKRPPAYAPRRSGAKSARICSKSAACNSIPWQWTHTSSR
jgi:hypothetical protein